MDRTNFLKAQPFLFPLDPAVSWPPPLPTETSERSSCRRETLLRDFWLSIEPLPAPGLSLEDREHSLSQQSIHTSRGPAFFVAPKGSSSSSNALTATNRGDSNDTNKQNDNFDPAMCPLELCVQSAILTPPPQASPTASYTDTFTASFSNRFTSPTAYQKLLRQQQLRQLQSMASSSLHNHRSKPQLKESTIFLKLDNIVYQMDLSHVENVDVQYDEAVGDASLLPEDDSKDGTSNSNTISRPTPPPSLLIQFGNSCVFRIFSLRGVTTDNLSTLQGVQNVLVQLLTADNQVPSEFPHQYYFSTGAATWASPAGSSTTVFSSSQEPGQRDFSVRGATTETPPSGHGGSSGSDYHRKPAADTSATSMEQGSGSKTGSASTEGKRGDTTTNHRESHDPHRDKQPSGEKRSAKSPMNSNSDPFSLMIRNRQAAFEQSKRDFDSLNSIILMHPLGPVDPKHPTKRLRGLQDQVQKLVQSVPESLAASYCTQSQLDEAIQRQHHRIYEYEMELDGLVNSFWPAPTRPATGTNHGNGTRNNNNDDSLSSSGRLSSISRRPQIESSECIRRANDLFEKHKEVVDEKLALSLLPTRGS